MVLADATRGAAGAAAPHSCAAPMLAQLGLVCPTARGVSRASCRTALGAARGGAAATRGASARLPRTAAGGQAQRCGALTSPTPSASAAFWLGCRGRRGACAGGCWWVLAPRGDGCTASTGWATGRAPASGPRAAALCMADARAGTTHGQGTLAARTRASTDAGAAQPTHHREFRLQILIRYVGCVYTYSGWRKCRAGFGHRPLEWPTCCRRRRGRNRWCGAGSLGDGPSGRKSRRWPLEHAALENARSSGQGVTNGQLLTVLWVPLPALRQLAILTMLSAFPTLGLAAAPGPRGGRRERIWEQEWRPGPLHPPFAATATLCSAEN